MRNYLVVVSILLLFLAAVWMAYSTIVSPPLYYIKVANWQKTPVSLQRAEVVQTGQKSRDRKLIVQYRYVWGGTEYVNDRIAIYPKSVSIPKDLRQSLLMQFKEQAENENLNVFVNADNPHESVLVRDFFPAWYAANIYLLLLSIYWMFGFGWVINHFGSTAKNTGVDKSVNSEAHRKESPAWKFVAYFAGFFTLLGIGITLMIIRQVRLGDTGALFFLIFPAASLALWWLTWYVWRHRFEWLPKEQGVH